MPINWKNIRTLNGSQAEGFEQFCCQLASREAMPQGAKFIRKGKPDAGVECYWTLPTTEEIAWQAKYFLTLDTTQWAQLDESMKTALDKHPKLLRYYVCVPLDLPDARVGKQKSALQKWQERVAKWEGWAKTKGMSVEFVWWGSHEMLDKLATRANAGLTRFWFDAAVLDPLWFEDRLKEAIVAAGPRYTPDVNVELPIVKELEAFGRTSAWLHRLKKFASRVSKVKGTATHDVDKLGTLQAEVEKALALVDAGIVMLRDITVDPTAPVSFSPLLSQIQATQAAIRSLYPKLTEAARLDDQTPSAQTTDRGHRGNPFRSIRYRLYDVDQVLTETAGTLSHTGKLAESTLLLLNGIAGMGKTHLLCDLAMKRQKAGLPTVLLMGQRFRQPAEPWTQVLQQLHMAQWSAEEFVGALETVAQSVNARLLVMIDALNEGAGREIWPDHMSAFLQLIARSPWIGVVVSVRSSYEELVLPQSVIKSASRVTHGGFADHEYDASKTFFKFYGIELPSTPLLAPEYRSPLFLKSICEGLKEAGHKRLPRGFHGISKVFRLYTDAINCRLAKTLNYDPKSELVQKALKSVVAAFPSHRQQWLSRSDAMSVVDALLPGRGFQDSLYQGLVGEGLLVENLVQMGQGDVQEFVNLAYERLADHFTADSILEKIVGGSGKKPSTVASLTDDDSRLSPGVLESLFIQAPETLGKELLDFAASITSHFRWEIAYRQSLIWRAPNAFTDRALYWFNQSLIQESDKVDALEIILTLASVPDHPWNADFLDTQLRKRKMGERDEWWTLKLHYLYGDGRSAVHRLIDWALSVKATDVAEDESVRLVSLTLAWLLSSSNRYLRDRATKAAANLLASREKFAVELVRKFATVDDLYIRERVLAIAYGVAMRLNDADKIQPLADAVMETVFAESPFVAHQLLRDYARGVVERLHVLSPQPKEVLEKVRPPYGGKWPRIPSKKTIDALEKSLNVGNQEAWGARRIIFSVMDDDFGRYVIGTNSWSTDFLAIRLDEPQWRSYSERLDEFRTDCDLSLSPLWDAYDAAESKSSHASLLKMFGELGPLRSKDALDNPNLEDFQTAIDEADSMLAKAEKALLGGLSPEQATQLQNLWKLRRTQDATHAPKFDLHLIQRYVAKRVFSMGWTIERFNHFDHHVISYDGRNAAKAERIGKKYQWIAYHEICALVADNFRYRNEMGSEGVEHSYQGPWQDYARDIDPSHSFLSTQGDSDSDTGWWAPQFEPDWGKGLDGSAWASNYADFPDLSGLVQRVDEKGHKWLVADVSFDRGRPVPEGMDRDETETRKFWCHVRSFLVRNEDVDAFMAWAENVDFWGQWMPKVPSSYKLFLGEYLWSPAWQHSDNSYYGNDGWVQPGQGCPVSVRTSAFEYHQESAGFDCSVDEGFALHLPDEAIVKAMDLRWTGDAADFRDASGQLVTQDPSVAESGPAALLLRSDMAEEMTANKGLSVCWIVLGERQAYLPGPMKRLGAVRISGACTIKGGTLKGFVKFRKGDHFKEGTAAKPIGEKRWK